jgi:hypothetical protein
LQEEELNLPVLLLVLQVTVPVGLEPETAAVQVAGIPVETGLGEQATEVEDRITGEEPQEIIRG